MIPLIKAVSYYGLPHNFQNKKFLLISKSISKIENFNCRFEIFDFRFENFDFRFANFDCRFETLSLCVQFSTVFIFDLTILLSAQNRNPKLSNRTSKLSFCKANFFFVDFYRIFWLSVIKNGQNSSNLSCLQIFSGKIPITVKI